MLLESQPSAEESDINSQTQSQATDINSTRTFSPAALPLKRCDAQDEDDDSAPTGSHSNSSPTLTQLASGSALCVSREEVVAASYEFVDDTESEQSEYLHTTNGASTLALEDLAGILPQQQNSRGSWAASRLFFRSSIPTPSPKTQDPYADWYARGARDDGDVSELSSQIGSTPLGGEPPIVPEMECIDHTKTSDVTDNSLTLPTDDVPSNEDEKPNSAISRCGMILRLAIIVVLALAVVIPLVVVLIHVRNNSIQNLTTPSTTATASTSIPTMADETSVPTITTDAPIQAPAQDPTNAPQATTTTPPKPAVTVAPTLAPTSVLALPTPAPAPTLHSTLPPFSAIWTESTWATATIRFGPLWSLTTSGSPLQVKVLSSLTNSDDITALEGVVRDWGEAQSINITLETTNEDCLPALGSIRVCNGAYGTTQTKFFSNVYVKSREIIAVTIHINDDFGVASDSTATSLRYNLCHEFGHALGLFHSSTGCMVDNEIAADRLTAYLRPDSSNFSELDRLYGKSDRFLRR
jgi:hypothetical protein